MPGILARTNTNRASFGLTLDSSTVQIGQKPKLLSFYTEPTSLLVPIYPGYGTQCSTSSTEGPINSMVCNPAIAQNGPQIQPQAPRGRGRPRLATNVVSNSPIASSTYDSSQRSSTSTHPALKRALSLSSSETSSSNTARAHPSTFQTFDPPLVCSTGKKPKLYEQPDVDDKRVKNAKSSHATRERKKCEVEELKNELAKRDATIQKFVENDRKKDVTISSLLHDLRVSDTFVLAATHLSQTFCDQIRELILQSGFSPHIRNVVFYPGLLQQLRSRDIGARFEPDTTERYNLGTSMDYSTQTLYFDAAPAQLFPQPPFTQVPVQPQMSHDNQALSHTAQMLQQQNGRILQDKTGQIPLPQTGQTSQQQTRPIFPQQTGQNLQHQTRPMLPKETGQISQHQTAPNRQPGQIAHNHSLK